MPRVYRVMAVDGKRPRIGSSARTLGVRVPPDKHADILVQPDGTVQPRTGGMSVAPSWRDLPLHRIPERLRSAVPGAVGNNKDACWTMGEGSFEEGQLAAGLVLRPESSNHGFVEPAVTVPLGQYQRDLFATRDRWVIDEE
jgi:hypothetical protein